MIPRVARVTIDGRVLLMTLPMTVTTAIVFGLVPALQCGARRPGRDVPRRRSRLDDGHRSHRLRSALVASEFALALVLLVGAGLMIRSFVALQHVRSRLRSRERRHDDDFDAGNEAGGSGGASGVLRRSADPHPRDSRRRVRRLHQSSADRRRSVGFPLPRRRPADAEARRLADRDLSRGFPGYFRAMRIPVLRGRDIDDSDRADAPKIVVINEFMATTYWPGQDAVGKRISVYGLPG